MDKRERQLVSEAINVLLREQDGESQATKLLEAALDPEPRSLQPNRLTGAERVYFDLWCAENKKHPAVNGGHSALALILQPDAGPVETPSQRDAEVAATVIQWLGTSCGRSFVMGCEKVIERERFDRAEWGSRFWVEPKKPLDLFDRMCHRILNRVLPHSSSKGFCEYNIEQVRLEIRAVMRAFFVLLCECLGKIDDSEAASNIGVEVDNYLALRRHALECVEARVAYVTKKNVEQTIKKLEQMRMSV